MHLYDPQRESTASFTTYIKTACLNNIRDESRRVKNPTHQKELLRAHNGDREMAHWWIDEDRTEWEDTKNGLDLVTRPVNVDYKDRPLAHWLLSQDPDTKVKWRDVLRQFPDYENEDKAGRALKRVKKAVEKAGFYRFQSRLVRE